MALWTSTRGTHMGDAAITHQVRARTKAAFGAPISPHLFRDCAATEIAISAPEHVQMIRPILGHTTLATSERHYNLAGSLEAGRRYSQTITALRRKTKTAGTQSGASDPLSRQLQGKRKKRGSRRRGPTIP